MPLPRQPFLFIAIISLASSQVLAGMNPFFSWLFFLILILLGLDSAFAWVHTLVVYVTDYFDERSSDRKLKRLKRSTVTFALGAILFLVGIVYTTSAGVDVIDVVDHYAPTYCLLFSALMEFVLFGWVYGVERTKALVLEVASADSVVTKFVLEHPRAAEFILKWFGPMMTGLMLLGVGVTDVFVREVGPGGAGLEAVGWMMAVGGNARDRGARAGGGRVDDGGRLGCWRRSGG